MRTPILFLCLLIVNLPLNGCAFSRARRNPPTEEMKPVTSPTEASTSAADTPPPMPTTEPVPAMEGVIESVEGEVQIQLPQSESKQVVTKGQKVPVGSALVTGPGSSAKIVMPDKNELDLSSEAELSIQTYENSATRKSVFLNLVKGKVRARVKEKYDGESNRFMIRTPAAVSGVRGTDFAMIFERGISQIVTFAGSVQFGLPGPNDAITQPVLVAAGQTSKAMANLPPSKPKTLKKEALEDFEKEFSPVQKEEPQEASAKKTDPPSLRWLRNGNIRFVKSRLRADGQGKKDILRLAKEQHPHAVILTSSDSRVSPEIIFDQKLGEIFVVRSMSIDAGVIASIEYAVKNLKVSFLLVLGQKGIGPEDPWANSQKLIAEILTKSEAIKQAQEQGLVIQAASYDLGTGVVEF